MEMEFSLINYYLFVCNYAKIEVVMYEGRDFILKRNYWLIVATYVIMHLSGIVARPIMMDILGFSPNETIAYWNIISFFAGLIVILLLLRGDIKRGSQRNASPISITVLWSVVGIFLAFIVNIIAGLIETQVLGIEPGSDNTMFIMEIIRSFPIFMIIPAIIAPILEEIVFRKVIFGTLHKRVNFFIAALLSSLVFGIIHGEPQHLLVYASMGFVFAFLYKMTNRIIVPIFAHAGMNSITVLLQYSVTPEQLEQMRRQLEEMMIFLGN